MAVHVKRSSPHPGVVIGWDDTRSMFFVAQMSDLTSFTVPDPWDGVVPDEAPSD